MVGAVLLAGGCNDKEPVHEETGSESEGQKVLVPVANGPVAVHALRVVYRREDTSGPQPQTTTETLHVRRPTEARLEIRNGAPPGAEVMRTTVVNREYRYELDGETVTSATRRVPGVPAQIVSATAMFDAAEAGVIERLGEGTVAGEACGRYAYRQASAAGSGSTVGRAPLQPATPRDRTESCVTPDGILVRRATTTAGKPTEVLEAVEVERDPEQAGNLFLTGVVPDPGVVTVSDDGVTITPESDAVPEIPLVAGSFEGFEAAPKMALSRVVPAGGIQISYLQWFSRDDEVLVVERLASARQALPWPAEEGLPVDIPGAASARLVFFPGYVELRVTSSAGPAPALVRADTRAAATVIAQLLPVRTLQLPGLDN